MSAFLTRLAGIALGEPAAGAARLSLPPRYAQPRAGDAGLEAIQAEEAPGGPLLRPGRASAHATPAHERAPDHAAPDSVPEPVEQRASPAAAEPVRREIGRAPHSPSARPAETAHAAPTTPPAGAAPPFQVQPPAPFPVQKIAGDPLLPPAPAVAQPGEVRIVEAGPIATPRPPPQFDPPQRAARERPSAPLSDRALVGRTERPRQAEPVIHVTIDRIDVRAPASPRPVTAARRPPAEPSVSLSDFLRGGPRIRQ